MFSTESDYTERDEDKLDTSPSHRSPVGRLSWLPEEEENVATDVGSEDFPVEFKQYMVDVLGATVGQREKIGTFTHRRRGEDSLAWGEPREWILVQWIRSLSQYTQFSSSALVQRLQESYTSLQQALEGVQPSGVERHYDFRKEERVRSFLREYPILISFLDKSYPYLRKHFGSESSYVLEVVKYPEGPEFDSLVVYIATHLSVDDALAKLDTVDREWYFDHIDRVGELVTFNLELQ